MRIYRQEEKPPDEYYTAVLDANYVMSAPIEYWKSGLLPHLAQCGSTRIHFECMLFCWRSMENLTLAAEVIRSFRISNEPVRIVASNIVQTLQQQSSDGQYDAVHLRVEADTGIWNTSKADRLTEAMGVMDMMMFGQNIYVASGIFSYSNSFSQIIKSSLSSRYGALVYQKGLVAKEVFESLNSEQQALVDLLVCLEARRFVGFGLSSFSFFVAEHRELQRGAGMFSVHQNHVSHFYGEVERRFLEVQCYQVLGIP